MENINAAAQLRKEMEAAAPFTKKEFIDKICDLIKKNGCAKFQTTNTGRTNFCDWPWPSIEDKDMPIAEKYAKEQGFFVTYQWDVLGRERYIRFISFSISEVKMAWVCVNQNGIELIYEEKPERMRGFWRVEEGFEIETDCVALPKGSIKKLIGRNLTWVDEPVELK